MSESKSRIADRAKRQIIMLSVIFLAGMAVNVLGMPSETQGAAMAIAALLTGLHVLIGVGLIVGAILTLRVAHGEGSRFTTLAWTGAVAVLAAFVAGMAMMATDNDWWSFIMAASFLAAMLAYGAVIVRAQRIAKDRIPRLG